MPQRTNIKLIEQASREKWMRRLAFFHLVKYHYNNSCLFDYKSRMPVIAGTLGMSVRSLYDNINALKSKELVREHCGNLVLKSTKDFGSWKKLQIFISDSHSLNDISCLLYGKLIEQRAKQQAFAESVRRYEKENTWRANMGRGDGYENKLSENPFTPSFSLRTIAKIINSTEFKAFCVIKNLNRLGVIKSENQKPHRLDSNCIKPEFLTDFPGNRFRIGDEIFEVYGARFQFLQFPVYLRTFSARQFITLHKRFLKQRERGLH